MSNYDLDFLTQFAEEHLGGSGGFTTTGLVKVEFGFKVYAKGLPQAESFFPFEYGNQDSTTEAFHEANRVAVNNGAKKPQFAIRFEVMKESVLETKQDGTKASENWKENRTYDIPTIWWNKDTRKTEPHPTFDKQVRPTLDAFVPKEDLGKWVYLQLGSELDSTNPESRTATVEKTIVDEDGNTTTISTPRKNYVPVVLRRFESEEEARAYVLTGEEVVTVKQPDAPTDWDEANWGSWNDSYPYILEQLNTNLPDLNAPPVKVNKAIDKIAMSFAPTDAAKSVLVAAIKSIQDARNNGIPF
jgi:hypothetical protein